MRCNKLMLAAIMALLLTPCAGPGHAAGVKPPPRAEAVTPSADMSARSAMEDPAALTPKGYGAARSATPVFPGEADMLPTIRMVTGYCNRPGNLPYMTADGCRGGLAHLAQGMAQNIYFETVEDCQDFLRQRRSARNSIVAEHNDWCDRNFENLHDRKGCYSAAPIFMGSLTDYGFCRKSELEAKKAVKPDGGEAPYIKDYKEPGQKFDQPKTGRMPGSAPGGVKSGAKAPAASKSASTANTTPGNKAASGAQPGRAGTSAPAGAKGTAVPAGQSGAAQPPAATSGKTPASAARPGASSVAGSSGINATPQGAGAAQNEAAPTGASVPASGAVAPLGGGATSGAASPAGGAASGAMPSTNGGAAAPGGISPQSASQPQGRPGGAAQVRQTGLGAAPGGEFALPPITQGAPQGVAGADYGSPTGLAAPDAPGAGSFGAGAASGGQARQIAQPQQGMQGGAAPRAGAFAPAGAGDFTAGASEAPEDSATAVGHAPEGRPVAEQSNLLEPQEPENVPSWPGAMDFSAVPEVREFGVGADPATAGALPEEEFNLAPRGGAGGALGDQPGADEFMLPSIQPEAMDFPDMTVPGLPEPRTSAPVIGRVPEAVEPLPALPRIGRIAPDLVPGAPRDTAVMDNTLPPLDAPEFVEIPDDPPTPAELFGEVIPNFVAPPAVDPDSTDTLPMPLSGAPAGQAGT